MRCITGPAVPLPASATTLDAAIEVELRRDFVNIGRDCIGWYQGGPCRVSKSLTLDDVEHFLDGFAVQGARAADALEAVVLGRIVAARNHDCAVGVEILRRIIEDWRRHGADVGDVAAGGQQPCTQRVAQARGTETAIAAQVDFSPPLCRRMYVPRPSPSCSTSGLSSSESATPRMSYSRKMVDLSISLILLVAGGGMLT